MKTMLLLRRALQSLDEELASDGLGSSERLVLLRLLEGDALPSELAEDLALSRGRLSHILRRLEDKGYVSLSLSERDRRSKRVSLRSDGRPLARRAEEELRGIEKKLQRELGDAEMMLLRQMLGRIAK